MAEPMPHGGQKLSGYGKDMLMYGLEDYTHCASHHGPALEAICFVAGVLLALQENAGNEIAYLFSLGVPQKRARWAQAGHLMMLWCASHWHLIFQLVFNFNNY
ncbi:hypothetical protein JFY74_07625 [Pectobacterium carotovorum]|nr:hypothetical protein JFY74_07625 [Pectobacterium carotovorum]